MIIQVVTENGEVLGSKDITGIRCTAVLDGFLNAEPIWVILDMTGVPAFTRTVDHSGNQLSGGGRIGPFGLVERGSTIHLDTGCWLISLVRVSTESHPDVVVLNASTK